MSDPIKLQLTTPQIAVYTAYQRIMATMSLEVGQLEQIYNQKSAAMFIANTMGAIQKQLDQFLRDCHTGIVVAQEIPKSIPGIINGK